MSLSLLTDDEICFVYTVLNSAYELKYDKNEERLEQLQFLKGFSEITDKWLIGVDITNVHMVNTIKLLEIKSEMGDRFFKKCLDN
jgi:hypothetical protein